MKKSRYYLETSVLNRLFDDADPNRKGATLHAMKILTALTTVEMCISRVVLDEVHRAPQTRREQILNWVKDHSPTLLEVDKDTETLAQKYVEEGLIPEKARNDALHIALSSIHGIDALLSWNMEHIVKLKTRRGVNGINKLLGYREIELVTPEEVI